MYTLIGSFFVICMAYIFRLWVFFCLLFTVLGILTSFVLLATILNVTMLMTQLTVGLPAFFLTAIFWYIAIRIFKRNYKNGILRAPAQ
jgi:hypothetical protein